ncbi:MAG: 2-oxo-4-hydroxy-4-carboxy-5-ureidoimidazoline decarboxylase, partial [Gemmobacter sp.]
GRDHTRASILAAFRARVGNDPAAEFAEACRQVERIAELRLMGMFGA